MLSETLPRLIQNLSAALIRRGHFVHFVTDPRSGVDQAARTGVMGTSTLRLDAPYYGGRSLAQFACYLPKTMLELRKLVRRYHVDVVNLHFINRGSAYVALLKRLTGVKLVTTIHGSDVKIGFVESRMRAWIARKCLQASDWLVSNSEALLRDAVAFYPPIGERSTAVGVGVCLEEFKSLHPYVHCRPYILTIGNCIHLKGHDLLINALLSISQSADVDLIIAGDGPELEANRELAQELGIESRIIFWGRAPRTDVVRLLNGCELFVLPSRQEAFGIVNLEAMAARQAVVATAVGGVPEVVRHGETGLLVPPESSQALADSVLALLVDENSRERMGHSGRSLVEAHYTWDKVASRYEQVYRGVLGSGGTDAD